ncbi:hypothetical protein K270103H11_00500 [Gordonibacter urolithinfaciens]
MLRAAEAPGLRGIAEARVPKYASPPRSHESRAPQPPSLTYYANLRGRYAASGRMAGALRPGQPTCAAVFAPAARRPPCGRPAAALPWFSRLPARKGALASALLNLRARYAASGRMGGSLRFRPINLCAPNVSRETFVR